MFQEDYIMRQIEGMTAVLARVLFRKDAPQYELPRQVQQYAQEDHLHLQLLSLLGQGKIKEAEELLFDALDGKNMRVLEIAVDFYSRANEFGDEYLAGRGVTREELEKNLQKAVDLYGITLPGFTD